MLAETAKPAINDDQAHDKTTWIGHFDGDDDNLTEAQLLYLAQRGNYLAYEALQERLMPQVWHFVRRLVGDGEVDDIVQEVFILFYKNLKSIDPPEKLRPFLFRMARNRSYDELRRAGRYDSVGLDEPVMEWVSLANQTSKPEETTHWLMLLIEVQEAIDRLPENQRQSLILYAEEGMSYAEIAEIMECSLGTVKSRIYYAKKNLRKTLHPDTLKALDIELAEDEES